MGGPILKSPEEVELMRPAGRVVSEALALVRTMVAPGMTTREIDHAVEELIRKSGGIPAFKGYPCATPGKPAFPASICASVNEVVVHGLPDDEPLREGDIISIDVGVELNGFFGDAARTFPVGSISRKAARLLSVTEACLHKAIAAMRPGAGLESVSRAIQTEAETNGFSVVKTFVGHGIGRSMHEPPQVPNYVSRSFADGRVKLPAGTVLAVEPMVNVGGSDVRVDRKNGWTVRTKDRTLSAHFEDSVAILEDGILNLTAA